MEFEEVDDGRYDVENGTSRSCWPTWRRTLVRRRSFGVVV